MGQGKTGQGSPRQALSGWQKSWAAACRLLGGLILGAQRPHMVHSVDGSALRPAAHDTMLAGEAQPVCLDWHLSPEG